MASRELESGPTSMRVRERLGELRRERRLTLSALSARLRDVGRPMSVSTLSKIENGDRRVDVDDLVALALAFDVSPNAIILPVGTSPATRVHLTPTHSTDAQRSWRWATEGHQADRNDVLVCHAPAEGAWAAWVEAQLRSAGQRVRTHVPTADAGGGPARSALRRIPAARVVVVYSAAYQEPDQDAPDWADALADARLVLLRVTDDAPPPALATAAHCDLRGLDEPAARSRLLETMGLAASPGAPASFPGAPTVAANAAASLRPRPTVWNVQPRLATFTGREGQLQQVRAGLGGRAVVAVQGLGGVGKTHLAVEYCYRFGPDYDLVWWVPAEEPRLLVGSLAGLAEQAGVAVPGHAQESAHAAVELLRTGGGGRFARWLVVLDNPGVPTADSEVNGLLGAAAAGGGHLLVTSRDPGWARLAALVSLDVLPRDDAVRLLRSRAKDVPAEQAGRLAEAVGDLPLALDQAGAWLTETGMSPVVYEDLLRRRAQEVLTRGSAPGQAPVAATWTVAIDQLEDPAAALLVRLWAHLGPEPIPLDLLDLRDLENTGLLPEALAGVARDPLALGDALARVSRLGLARLTGGAVTMHRLVQAVLRAQTSPDDHDRLRAMVTRLLTAAATGDPDDPENWPRYAQLYPHALAVDLIGAADPESRDAVLRFTDYLHALRDDTNADRLAREAHSRWARSLGENDPYTVLAAGRRVYMLRIQHDYLAARALAEDSHSRCRRLLGDDHQYTIKLTACLGATLRAQRDYPAARELFRSMIVRCQRVFGEDHLHTIRAVANLAATMQAQGDHRAAQALFEDVLPRRRRTLGEDHPHTTSAAANLAKTLRAQHDYAGARRLEEDVLARRRRTLGHDHPDTRRAVTNLAATLREQSDRDALEALLAPAPDDRD